mgnify:CR=1 FL=1
MVKRQDVVNEVCYLANRGIGVDADGYFGTQCADEIVYLIMKYFKILLEGNAIVFMLSTMLMMTLIQKLEIFS